MNANVNIEDFVFSRPDGKPFKILARGDCTSWRSTHLNKDMFPDGMTFVQNQKSPFILFLEAADGVSCTREALEEISDVSKMSGALPVHYMGQADRSILEESDADLIMMDTWADMNFDLWRSNREGWLVWIHPKFLRDPESFYKNFTKIGKRTLEQSLNDAEALVKLLRQKNPKAPVLFMNQQTDFYPRMDGRREYYDFGRMASQRIENSYFGGVIEKDDLQLADVGSCGPGQTLHYKAETYRSMFEKALKDGLGESISSGFRKIKKFALDNKERTEFPEGSVSFGYSEGHSGSCGNVDTVRRNFCSYIDIPNYTETLRWTPVVISIRDNESYESWERIVKKRYDRVRMKKRSERLGYVVHPFHPKLHVPDMHEIHHSAEARSGGSMRGDYLKSIEEMGGYPDRHLQPVKPACPLHWAVSMGVFEPLPGHKQGEIAVDEKLVGYINLRRSGDVLLYSRIMGHADHLQNGVMYHLHFDIVKWAFDQEIPQMQGLKYVMYGGIGNGGASLWQWKRTAGFEPRQLSEA